MIFQNKMTTRGCVLWVANQNVEEGRLAPVSSVVDWRAGGTSMLIPHHFSGVRWETLGLCRQAAKAVLQGLSSTSAVPACIFLLICSACRDRDDVSSAIIRSTHSSRLSPGSSSVGNLAPAQKCRSMNTGSGLFLYGPPTRDPATPLGGHTPSPAFDLK